MTQNTEQGYMKRGKRRNDKRGCADDEGWKLYYAINSRIFFFAGTYISQYRKNQSG